MQEREGFADMLVSHALQLNTRCLQVLVDAQRGVDVAAADWRAVLSDLARLESVWLMVRSGVSDDAYRAARDRLRCAQRTLRPHGDWAGQVFDDLAAKVTDERKLRALKRVGQEIDGSPGPGEQDLVGLGEMLRAESAGWRDTDQLRGLSPEALSHGVLRAYRKARKAYHKYAAELASSKRLERAARWVGYLANQLELLAPGLSDAKDEPLTAVVRLHDVLAHQVALQRLSRLVDEAGNAKRHRRVRGMLAARCRPLHRRSEKLIGLGLEASADTFRRWIDDAVGTMGVGEISLAPIDSDR